MNDYKNTYTKGMRVCLIKMVGEPQMPVGLLGTVDYVDDWPQVHVHWDNGSSLAFDPEIDEVEIV